ncbi:MAG: DNA gyrase inhibitor YacG [Rhodoblastus sp.]
MSKARPPAPARACPICKKASVERYKPFCSKRCASIDLNRWLSGGYAIAGAPAGDEDDETIKNSPPEE